MNTIFDLINNKDFENIKKSCEENNILVKENANYPDLFLLSGCGVNGVIFEKNTNRIVCSCKNQLLEFDDFVVNSDVRLEYCEDGTFIKFYYYQNNWMTSTNKCIDGKDSFWSCQKSFDELFWEIFNTSDNLEILSHLDKNKTYFFVLNHRENRIVVNHKFNNLIYISSIDNETQEEDFTNVFYNKSPHRNIRRVKNINNSIITENFDFESLYNKMYRGVIIKINGVSYKYDFKEYILLKSIRGNTPDIKTRYIELLNNPEALLIIEKSYPEYKNEFITIKRSLYNLYKKIHSLYIESHIKHVIKVEETHVYFQTLKQLHAEYKNKNIIITLSVVRQKINSLNKYAILKLINA